MNDPMPCTKVTDPIYEPTSCPDGVAIEKDPIVLEGYFMELLRGCFSSECNLRHRALPWKGERAADGVRIVTGGELTPDLTQKRPGIYVFVGYENIDAQGDQGIGGASGLSERGSLIHQSRTISAQLRVVHVAETRDAAYAHALTSLRYLDTYAYAIVRDVCLVKFSVVSMVEPTLRKDPSNEWSCTVTAKFQFKETFSLRVSSPLLKQMVTVTENASGQSLQQPQLSIP